MSEQVQKLFDTIAHRYDLINSLLSLGIDRQWRNQAVKKIQGREFGRVLDLCAGTLALTISLLEVNPVAQVTAVDFSEAMLNEGRKGLPPKFRSRVESIVADVMTMEIPPPPPLIKGGRGGFDAIMCAYGMRNVDNNDRVLRKIRSFLRPGGRLVILEFFRPEGILSQVFNLTYGEFVIPILGKLVSRHPNAYQYLRDSVRNFYTPSAYRELLRGIGFEKISIKAQTGGISHLITAEAGK